MKAGPTFYEFTGLTWKECNSYHFTVCQVAFSSILLQLDTALVEQVEHLPGERIEGRLILEGALRWHLLLLCLAVGITGLKQEIWNNVCEWVKHQNEILNAVTSHFISPHL